MASKLQTLHDLYKFYYEFVKPLYSSVQVENELPIETLFEINAAFDHVSRHWFYGDSEADAVEKAYSHLKRSCLDIFKLEVKKVADNYRDLRRIDTSVLDNGDFDRDMVRVLNEIRSGAATARTLEGDTKSDDHSQMIKAFEHWFPVYDKCVEFQKRFFLHPRFDWARRNGFWKRTKELWWAILFGFVTGVLSSMTAAWVVFHFHLFGP